MLELEDYRKSRFYQEAHQDGVDEGKAEEQVDIIRRMAAKGFDLNQISDIVGVDIASIKEILKSPSS